MSTAGYYRTPTVFRGLIAFVCEDDLWLVPAEGGTPRRLTSNLGAVSTPRFSPDGTLLAFVGRDEGPSEVYVMPAVGGQARRLTFQGALCSAVGWRPDGGAIHYTTNAAQPFTHVFWLWDVGVDGGTPVRWNVGPADQIAYGPGGSRVIARHARRDPAWWKRYRGGTAGRLWIDVDGSGDFAPLVPANGNFTSPMWIGDRIYFISDHEGIGNLYSCLPSGEALIRHTHHEDYYVRSASTDGERIVYHAGGDLYSHDLASNRTRKVEIDYRSPLIQRQRKFVDPGRFLQGYSLHPDGHALCANVRGKVFTLANWEGAVLQHGERHGARYRLTRWLHDGKRLVTVSDAGGEEAIEVHARDGGEATQRLDTLDVGRVMGLEPSPTADQVVLRNHRYELLLVDLAQRHMRVLASSPFGPIYGLAWSPDGRWIAYGFCSTERTASIKIASVETGESRVVTPPEFNDLVPSWDPQGKYLYFLSLREFNPVYDALHFDLGFPQAMRPFLVTLKADTPNPFVPQPRPLQEKKAKEEERTSNGKPNGQADENADDKAPPQAASQPSDADEKPKPVDIDFEGIDQRVVAFPYPEGRYGRIAGIDGKVLFTTFPVRGARPSPGTPRDEAEPEGVLHVYDFEEQKKDTIASGIDDFRLSLDRKTLVYRAGRRLRVVKAGAKPDENAGKDGPNRRGGWIDLARIRAEIVPLEEWRQMYREAWRLQRDFFWTQDMSGIDWEQVYQRYLPLLDRIATRTEFSDLMWEMQGELGTSHAYEMGGDYRPSPSYPQGFLAADFNYDEASDAYRVTHVVRGDPWDDDASSPLTGPAAGIAQGDLLVAIGGQRLGKQRQPNELLVNAAGLEVELGVRDGDTGEERTVTVKARSDEYAARYREWVETNRQYVHERTDQKIGYLHIPDMSGRGYAEFHRGFLAELNYPGLIVDVRHNRGGHVSPLLLEKLARRRLGYDVRRWGTPIPYPSESVMGPMVALTDENAGSDGDIFSHCFKLMKLGLLIGTRTWGGVIGISPKSTFVDGGTTTQPEYSFWFVDVEWGVENYGTDPDVEVPYRPQDYASGVDPQLHRAIAEIMAQFRANPPAIPDMSRRPRLTLPRLQRPPEHDND